MAAIFSDRMPLMAFDLPPERATLASAPIKSSELSIDSLHCY